jgi:hypothetical protein
MSELRDGVIKRGGSWSYVIRVPDPATGVSKPKWVGGFDTKEAAKAARDEARVRARNGQYVHRSTSTVADYLTEWLEAHAATVKPKTLAGYRHDIDHYIVPRIGRMRLQALRPAVISKLYRDLAEHGGRGGRALSATTVSHIHRTLRKALADAVDVEQLLAANPAARSKRPRSTAAEPVQVWTAQQLGTFLATARSHRLFAFYHLAAYTGARRGELLYLRWSADRGDRRGQRLPGVADRRVDAAQVGGERGGELAAGRRHGIGRGGRFQDARGLTCGDLSRDAAGDQLAQHLVQPAGYLGPGAAQVLVALGSDLEDCHVIITPARRPVAWPRAGAGQVTVMPGCHDVGRRADPLVGVDGPAGGSSRHGPGRR